MVRSAFFKASKTASTLGAGIFANATGPGSLLNNSRKVSGRCGATTTGKAERPMDGGAARGAVVVVASLGAEAEGASVETAFGGGGGAPLGAFGGGGGLGREIYFLPDATDMAMCFLIEDTPRFA